MGTESDATGLKNDSKDDSKDVSESDATYDWTDLNDDLEALHVTPSFMDMGLKMDAQKKHLLIRIVDKRTEHITFFTSLKQ